jgi:hypothetical protein
MTTVDGILKEVYESQIRDQLQSEVKTLRRIEKTSEGVTEEVGGKYVTFPLRIKRNHGIGARNESEALPAARSNSYTPARVGLTYQYGSIELTGQVFELAEKNFQAFASALQQEIDGLKQTLAKDANRQVYGTSTGKLSTANAAGTTTTLVCSNAEAIYLEIGMIVDIYDNTDTVRASSKEITNVVRDSPADGSTTVTFSTASGTATASGDYMVRDDSYGKELIGLSQIVDDSGTLYNVDPATVPLWKAEVDDPGANRALSEGLMINMVDQIRTNGGKTTVGFCSLGVRRSYFNLLSQLRRFTNTMEFEGGFSGLAFTTDWGDIPIVSDFDCPWNKLFFVNEKELKIYQTGDWSWMNRDGSHWQRVIGAPSGGGAVNYYDAYTATMYKYYQMGTHRRNSHGVIGSITEG